MRVALTVLCLLSCLTGCVGEIRETTTERTSTEQLLLSTAAERAIARFGQFDLVAGKRVAVDDTRFDSYDKGYAISALRHHLAEHGARLVPLAGRRITKEDGTEVVIPPDLVVEVRNGALGLNDSGWGIGVPPLPLPIPQTDLTTTTPPIFLFYRGKQEGWAKFQLWIYDPVHRSYQGRSDDLWGHAYYSKWWLFFIGPFDFSNDIYPDEDPSAEPEAQP